MNAHIAISQLLHDLPSAATATFLALFPIVNPLGGIPLFFSLTADFPAEERHRTAVKTAIYVIAILVIFMLVGRFVLNFFGISLPVLKIAGGLIVANTAWGMVTGSSRMTTAESSEALTKEDISLTPMACPCFPARAPLAWSWDSRPTPIISSLTWVLFLELLPSA
jgi:multiple antibiotic resistance protein